MNWHNIKLEETISHLKTTASGITSLQAQERLKEYGPNTISTKEHSSLFALIIEQFLSPLVLILVAACVFSIWRGDWIEAVAIMTVLIINAILGVVQQYKSEGALEALRKMSAPRAHVFRDGAIQDVLAIEVTPGDLVVLYSGDLVPADLRLTEAINLACNEAILTGESNPVNKDTKAHVVENATIGDQYNMAFMGTVVTTGRGKGIVVGTGKNTAMGAIASSLASVKREKTPLEIQLAQLGGILSVVFLVICGIVFLIGWLEKGNPFDQLLLAISLAVAAIPEGLPAVVTIVLSIGTTRMSKHNAIVRRLSSVETLGCTTYICTDKTGTLTENKMRVERAFVNMAQLDLNQSRPTDVLGPLAKIAAGCNDADYNIDGVLIGDPTETALVEFADLVGVPLDSVPLRIDELPFDSNRKAMTTVHKEKNKVFAYTKGAFENILKMSDRIDLNNKVVPIDEQMRKILHEEGHKLTTEGYRTMGFAYKIAPTPEPVDRVEEHHLVLVGFLGLTDPIRSDVPEAVLECIKAGIKPVMVTGDHPQTAMIYARKLGMAGEHDKPVTGEDFANNHPDLDSIIPKTKVFARVSPQDKLRIVEVLQRNGEVVAMTGDGVNDAPALKKADIGISMGKTGSEVAKDAASLILADDSFSTIEKAIYEGRVIYDNILKFIWYMLGANFGEVFVLVLALIFNTGIPLAPIQLLWINLLTDGLPGLALGMEPAEPGIMNRPPRDPKQKILTGKMLFGIIFRGLIMGGVVFVAFLIGNKAGGEVLGRTYAFTVCVITELLLAYVCRSFTKSIFQLKPLENPQMLFAIFISLCAFAITLIPGLQFIFKTTSLSFWDFDIIIGLALLPPISVEIWKRLSR